MVKLKMSPEKAIRLLHEKVNEITAMRENQESLGYYDVVGWCSKTWSLIDDIFEGDSIHSEEIRVIGLPVCACEVPGATRTLLSVYQSHLLRYIQEIRAGTDILGDEEFNPDR